MSALLSLLPDQVSKIFLLLFTQFLCNTYILGLNIFIGNEKNIRNDNSESTMMMAVKSGKRESHKPEAKPTKKLISKDLDITYVET